MFRRRCLIEKILVTGGAEFLGSHLCSKLIDEGLEVIAVDNFYKGNKTNITHLLNNPRFELVRHDVTFSLYFEMNEIYNLAFPEEVAFKKNLISIKDLENLAKPLIKNSYGQYLVRLTENN